MNKKQVGWLINGILTVGAVATSIIFPNPSIIFPVVAGATLTGTLQSMFTIVETKEEKLEKEGKRIQYSSQTFESDSASREKENIGNKEFIMIATNENSKSNPNPVEIYKNLHSNPHKATFSGTHKTYSSSNVENIRQDEERIL